MSNSLSFASDSSSSSSTTPYPAFSISVPVLVYSDKSQCAGVQMQKINIRAQSEKAASTLSFYQKMIADYAAQYQKSD